MFGKGNKKSDIPDIPLLTIDHFPSKEYEVLGLVTAHVDNVGNAFKHLDINNVKSALQASAIEIGADAVIGVRLYQYVAQVVVGYGTAIKFN